MTHKDGRGVSERRFTLLTRLALGAVTLDDMKSIPAYAELADGDISAESVQRLIERDIETLRDSGYTVLVSNDGYGPTYRLDDSSNIRIDGTGIDLSLLHHLLRRKARSESLAFAQSGVTKLLSTGSADGSPSPYSLHIPDGASVTDIASAVQLGKRVAFTYESASSAGPADYVVEPLQIVVHFGSFYVRAWQVSKDGDHDAAGPRIFKLTRVTGSVTILDDDATHSLTSDASDHLRPVTVELEVDDDRLPLAMKGRHRSGHVELVDVMRTDLYDDLIFHGPHARIVSPPEVAEDFANRLAHLAKLGQSHG